MLISKEGFASSLFYALYESMNAHGSICSLNKAPNFVNKLYFFEERRNPL